MPACGMTVVDSDGLGLFLRLGPTDAILVKDRPVNLEFRVTGYSSPSCHPLLRKEMVGCWMLVGCAG